MSEEQSGQTRSEQPTPKKLKDSRSKGQVARSRELNTTIVLLVSSLGLFVLGGDMGLSLQEILVSDLQMDRQIIFSKELLLNKLYTSLVDSVLLILPFLLVTIVASIAGPLLLGGWTFSASSWKPKLSRLSPLAGMKRMFGTQGLIETIKALGKFCVIGVIAYTTLKFNEERILSLSSAPVDFAIYTGSIIVGQLFFMLSLSLILVSLIDVPYQLMSHVNRLKMSVQEIKEENKQTNGNPEVKNQIRTLQREVSSRRMLQDVADADVVIVNPTHFSVALKYDKQEVGAPVVVAKGVDFMAMRIREIAKGNAVEVFSAPPLARALYHHTEVGQEVPHELYQAVAQVLAYVYQVRDLSRVDRKLIERPERLPIPSDLRHPSDDDGTR